MKQIKARDPVARMDEIFRELSELYTEADQLLNAYVDRVCADAPVTLQDMIRQRVRKGAEHE
jgi:hypothetical protein